MLIILISITVIGCAGRTKWVVAVKTHPPDASVYGDDKFICKTPCDILFDRDPLMSVSKNIYSPNKIMIKKDGYKEINRTYKTAWDLLPEIGYVRNSNILQFNLEPQPSSMADNSFIGQKTPPSPVIKSDIDELPAIMSEPRKNAYAVVIGIENYRSLPKSDYSGNDAALVKAYLKSLGFQERNIDFIIDEKATKTDIEKSLEAWLPNRATKDSLIIIYFSGHGAPEPSTGETYIVPYDGDPNYLPVTGYPLKRLYERLGKLEAKEIVVVLDSCFSGAGGRSVLAKGARPLVMMADTRILASNMAILTATQGSQISTSSPEKGHGIFTYYFLKAIKDGKRNLAEIYEYIKPQVEDEAKQINVQQSPSLNPAPEKLTGRFNLRK